MKRDKYKRDKYYSCPHCRVLLYYDEKEPSFNYYCKKCKKYWDICNLR